MAALLSAVTRTRAYDFFALCDRFVGVTDTGQRLLQICLGHLFMRSARALPCIVSCQRTSVVLELIELALPKVCAFARIEKPRLEKLRRKA